MQNRLNKSEKKQVCERYVAGENSVTLSRQFGVSVPAICGLLNRRGIERRSQTIAQKRCALNETAFDILTPEACYWTGFLFADGCISKRSGSAAITLRLSETDSLHVEKFKQFVGSSHKTIVVKPNESRPASGRCGIQLSFRSEKIARRLEELGMSVNLQSIAIPELAESTHFWRGVIDGDGCIGYLTKKQSHQPRVELVGGEALLSQFVQFVHSVCPESAVTSRPQKNIFRVGLSCKTALAVISSLYGVAPVALERKHNAAINILKSVRTEPLGANGSVVMLPVAQEATAIYRV